MAGEPELEAEARLLEEVRLRAGEYEKRFKPVIKRFAGKPGWYALAILELIRISEVLRHLTEQIASTAEDLLTKLYERVDEGLGSLMTKLDEHLSLIHI